MKEAFDKLPEILPPKCFRNTFGDNFAGDPKAEPSAFCRCSSLVAPGTMSEGNYATMEGDGDKACTYSVMPTAPISISTWVRPTEKIAVTTCRVETL